MDATAQADLFKNPTAPRAQRPKAGSQAAKVLSYLAGGGSLTPRDAQRMWECWRLASVVHALRGKGWPIKGRLEDNGNGSQHSRYWMGRDTP